MRQDMSVQRPVRVIGPVTMIGTLRRHLGTSRWKVPKLKCVPFETAIIEHYRRRVHSPRRRHHRNIVGAKVSPSTISELNKKAYVHIEEWRNRRLRGGKYPYVYVDGIYLRRNWGGEYENVSVLVAIAVNEDGYREVLGAAEGMKEDKASWIEFFKWLKSRGLDGVRLVIGDKSTEMCFQSFLVQRAKSLQKCSRRFTLKRANRRPERRPS